MNMKPVHLWRYRRPIATKSQWQIPTRANSQSTRFFSTETEEEPFYGKPRPPQGSEPRSVRNRLTTAFHYATTALADPTRADAVAALGEITGPISLRRLRAQMNRDPVGRRLLQERPVVSKATIPYDRLIAEAASDVDAPGVTFGQAYGYFLKSHDFDPDERDEVKFIEDDELAYIMLRYRQVRNYKLKDLFLYTLPAIDWRTQLVPMHLFLLMDATWRVYPFSAMIFGIHSLDYLQVF